MSKVLEEGNLRFDFSTLLSAERFDDKRNNAYGMKAVDFVVEDAERMFFIEAKDYQNPSAPAGRRKTDYEMLITAVNDKGAIFPIEMGAKIKDSLLRKFAEGGTFSKKVVYLLLINLDKLGAFERGMLTEKICGHIPTGLNESRFCAFTSMEFRLVNAEQLNNYGIVCTAIAGGAE